MCRINKPECEQDDVSNLSWVEKNVADQPDSLTRKRALLTKQLVKNPSIDVGCNTAGYTMFCGMDMGLDFVKKHLLQAKSQSVKTEFVCGDAVCLPFRNKVFETVVAMEIIEHVDNPEDLVREICRVGKSIIVTTPYGSLEAPVGYELRAQHLTVFTEDSLKAMFSKYMSKIKTVILTEKNIKRMIYLYAGDVENEN